MVRQRALNKHHALERGPNAGCPQLLRPLSNNHAKLVHRKYRRQHRQDDAQYNYRLLEVGVAPELVRAPQRRHARVATG
jgi:hypothetical protein